MAVIDVSESAAAQIKRLLDQEGKLVSHGLRLKVVGGGCSGLQYQLSFEEAEAAADQAYDIRGVTVLVDDKSAIYLVGSTLDYIDTLQESGFKITNPNASTTCGCGQSFGA